MNIANRSKKYIDMSVFSKPGSLFALSVQLLLASQSYQIKYEPMTRQCDFFVNLEYVAHFDLNSDDTGCMFLLAYPAQKCTLIQTKNSARSAMGKNSITLEPKMRNRVAFNGYVCD